MINWHPTKYCNRYVRWFLNLVNYDTNLNVLSRIHMSLCTYVMHNNYVLHQWIMLPKTRPFVMCLLSRYADNKSYLEDRSITTIFFGNICQYRTMLRNSYTLIHNLESKKLRYVFHKKHANLLDADNCNCARIISKAERFGKCSKLYFKITMHKYGIAK